MDEHGDDHIAFARAARFDRPPIAELSRGKYGRAALQLPDLVLLSKSVRHFDLALRPRPQHLRVLRIGNRKLHLQQDDRLIYGTAREPRIANQRPGDNRVVKPRWGRLGEAQPASAAPPRSMYAAAHSFVSFRT
jgi:hypothetical protein